MDQEFDKIVDRMDMAIVNTYATNEHVTDAERNVHTIKDGTRCSVEELRRIRIHTLPKQVIIHMVNLSVSWINAPPATNGISTVHSPREIVLKRSVDFDLHCRADFRQYIHAHIEPEKSNDMNGRTFAVLYLGPTGNLKGTVKTWDINTGRARQKGESVRRRPDAR